MQCPRCQRENRPDAKFCEECAAPLGLACPNCGTAVPPTARFCSQCAHPLQQAAPHARFATPDTYTPKYLAEKILGSRSSLEGERKQITVLFADMKGSMELLADRDPEEARELLDAVLERMMDAVHRYEGTVNQVMGDGVMALFGAPVAHEDHALRACYAALRMQEAVARYAEERRRHGGADAQIRVGLNSGEVVVRSIGSDLRLDYTAVGQTTHTAARMEQHARPGSIVLTTETLQLVTGFVDVRPLGRLMVRGLSEAIEAHELVGAVSPRSRLQVASARGLTRFVGRGRELEGLRQSLGTTADGHGQVVALVGEAGVGKSRLIWELRRSGIAEDWLKLEATANSYGKTTAFVPVIDLLRAYFKIDAADPAPVIREKVVDQLRALDAMLEDAVAPLLAVLGALPEGHPAHSLDPPERRRRTIQAVRRLLVRESLVRPILLVIEDLHWADSETLRFLNTLVDTLPTARLLLLVSYRPDHQHGWGSKTYYAQLRIDPLPPETAEELLDALIGGDVGLRPLRQLLVERTEGNPFFLEEMVRNLVETGILVGQQGGYRLGQQPPSLHVPPTVQAVIAARIDRLLSEDKRVLQSAAVIGKDVPVALLRVLAEVSDEGLEETLTRLQAAELLQQAHLFPEVEYTFKHTLTHDVAYGSLLHERRRILHGRVLRAIEAMVPDRTSDHAELLAHHALGGEVWDKAIDYLRESGARAYARGALRKALDCCEQALALLPRLPGGRVDVERAIDVRLDLHAPLFGLGQIPRLVALHREGAALAEKVGDNHRLGRVLSRLGLYAFVSAAYREGLAHAERAAAISKETRDPELSVTTSYFLGVNHLAMGHHRAAIDFLTPLVDGPHAELARRVRGLSASPYILACGWLAGVYSLVGDFDLALAYGQRGVDAAQESDHPYGQAIAHAWRVIPLAHRGDFVRALGGAQHAVELCERNELFGWLPLAYSLWGWVLSGSGRPEDGLPYIERAVSLFEAVGVRTFLALRYVEQAQAFLLADRLDEAQKAGGRGLELAQSVSELGSETWALYVLGECAAAVSPDTAEPSLEYFERARALGESLGMRPLVARCRLGLGALYRRIDRRQTAIEHLQAARGELAAMGMEIWRARAEAELAAVG
jgi:class 3 adenylate cyclase/tetratricopeptide (TPR) repeat protein